MPVPRPDRGAVTSGAFPIPPQASLDEAGRLLHEDDPAAQLALGLAGIEACLADLGLGPDDLTSLRVTTVDHHRIGPVLDVLTERLAQTGARPLLTVHEVERLSPHGLLVLLDGTARPPHPVPVIPGPTQRENPMTLTTPDPHPLDRRSSDLGPLVEAAPGRVHLPGTPGYDAARMPWNLAVDQRPAAVAVPQTVEEVVALVRTARRLGLRVAPQSTGHGAALLHGRLAGSLLLRMHELTGVRVDGAARTARVVGGTTWAPVVHAAAEHGLTAAHGSAPDVGVVGYTLSGGMSFYGRQHGLAVNHVRAVELVTPDGRLVRCSATEESELFWAVRGAGGNLGVVVAVEIDLLPLAEVYAGMLLWEASATDRVVSTWARWVHDLPESVTTSLRVMHFPPIPDLPPFLSGRDVVVVDGAVLEEDAEAERLLAPLRDLAPEMDTFGRVPTPALLDVHMDPPMPTPAATAHAVLGHLDVAGVAAFVRASMEPSGLMFTELRHVGGAFARAPRTAGVLGSLPGDLVLHCVGVAPTPEAFAAVQRDAAAVLTTMRPWRLDGRSLTFTDEPDMTPGACADAFTAEDWARVAEVRSTVDPGGVMQAAVEVG